MIHLPALIADLALILGVAALVTLVFKKLKQPVVLGYIVAGLLVGPNFKLFPTVIEIDGIKTWAEIGVIFLLFGLGLEFSFKKLIRVGGVAVITAITEVSLTLITGYGVGRLLGWNSTNSLFLGGILAIASTTIIIRAFDELGVKGHKFAGIVMGVLVIEDLVAVLLMVLLSTVAVSQAFSGLEMITAVLELAFFLVLWFVFGIFFIPTFFRKIRLLINEETLLIISLALCFILVVVATYLGFSPALGAFIMGSILAETRKAEKIEQLTKSVKTLFGAIFFVSVGMLIDPQMLVKYTIPIFVSTLVLLFGKPLFVIIGALIAGQPLKIAVKSGMSLSQIGEFSFIIAALGLSLNVTGDFLYPIAVAVSVVTTFTTPYMIRLSNPAYRWIESALPAKWISSLTAYSVDAQQVAEISDWRIVLRAYISNMIMFSIIIVALILVSTQYLVPLFSSYGWSEVFLAVFTLMVLAPFLWALAFRRFSRSHYAKVWMMTKHRGPLIVLELTRIALALFYIGFLFDRIFSPYIALVGFILSCIILIFLNKKIKSFYAKIELRFMENLNERDSETKTDENVLTPWDTHITKFGLPAHSPFIGKPLSESKIREEFGVNIVVIERGDIVINVPGRNEQLYPNDIISVIGTDDQLNEFKSYLESYDHDSVTDARRRNISLFHFTVNEDSKLIGQSIRGSKIRERTNGLIVGIERRGKRILNPESDEIFEVNDKLWLVGSEMRIQVILKEMTPQDTSKT
jgi:CPA2 family monovalent cation:H+ antiporter-2